MALSPVIEARDFRFRYRGAARAAVQDVTFTVQPGEIFGFLGPSGAGKSTTQNVLIGLLDGYEGTVNVLGRDLRSTRLADRLRPPQHPRRTDARGGT